MRCLFISRIAAGRDGRHSGFILPDAAQAMVHLEVHLRKTFDVSPQNGFKFVLRKLDCVGRAERQNFLQIVG